MKETTVGEIVRGQPVYVVQQDNSVLDAARYMTEYQIGAVPVLSEGDLVGIFSERDLMTRVVARELDPSSTKVGEVMTSRVAVLDENRTCQDALAIMKRLRVRHLSILVGKRIVGCISLRDLQEVGIETRNVEIEFLDDYIEKEKAIQDR